jgi:hypothetical protein
MYELIASGNNTNFLSIPGYDDQIEEGQPGLLRMNFTTSISAGILDTIEQEMVNHGVQGARVNQSGKTVNIYFQKGLPPLAIIIPILLALIVTLAIILVTWHIFKDVVPAGLQGPLATGIIIAGIAIVGMIAYKRLRG